MGVNEDTMDEIFNERAYYLFNVDELLLERLGEQTPGNRMGISSGFPYIHGTDRLETSSVNEY